MMFKSLSLKRILAAERIIASSHYVTPVAKGGWGSLLLQRTSIFSVAEY
jgi:hypothetical protein